MDDIISGLNDLKLKKKLLILDLNGVLIDRILAKEFIRPIDWGDEIPMELRPKHVGGFLCWKRKNLKSFLKYIFKNFTVAVWSSAKLHNTKKLVEFVFGSLENKLLFIWGQDRCGKEPHPTSKVKPLFLKNLVDVWKEFPEYSLDNTLLIDDSILKNKNNPVETYFISPKWTYIEITDDGLSKNGIIGKKIHNFL
jgi:hypothetical protein